MNKTRVELGPRSYDVVSGANALDQLPALLAALGVFERTLVITDSNVHEAHGGRLDILANQTQLFKTSIAPGEASKSIESAHRLLNEMTGLGMRRGDLIVAYGGGVVGDLAGFVASVYLRGIAFIQVPTTLLGQVDASVGGKTGVNLTLGKNLVGTFHQPSLVVADTTLLETLPEREFISGMAEVVKYGLCFGGNLFDLLTTALGKAISRDVAVVGQIVALCIASKAAVVANDETDLSARAVLNYGHTFGHALEAWAGYGRFRHGEAISIGMMFAAGIARNMGLLDSDAHLIHEQMLGGVGLPLNAKFDRKSLAEYWSRDKKHQTHPRWVLLHKIGYPQLHSDVTDEAIQTAFDEVSA
ncbi:MAG: 3-dehydroquinate synthase [Actinomycetota bacterium]